jgi:hypothetical protein
MAVKQQLGLTSAELELLRALTRDQVALLPQKGLKSLDQAPGFSDAERVLLQSIAQKYAIHAQLIKRRYKISASLFDLWEGLGSFVMLMDSFFTLGTAITLGGMLLVGSIFVMGLCVVGGLYFVASYREHKQKENAANQNYMFLALKMVCEQAVLYHECHPDIDLTEAALLLRLAIPETTNTEAEKKEIEAARRWPRIRSALFAGVLTTSTLFYTYYAFTLGLSLVLASTAVVGAMVNPIGLGIVLGVLVLAGIYLGYKKYQSCKQQEALRDRREAAKTYFEEQHEQYERRVSSSPSHQLRCIVTEKNVTASTPVMTTLPEGRATGDVSITTVSFVV